MGEQTVQLEAGDTRKCQKEKATKYRIFNLKEQTDFIATFSGLTTSSSSDHETGNHLLEKLEVVSFSSGKIKANVGKKKSPEKNCVLS